MDIGEVAALAGVAPSALRFYEEQGLIRSSGRNGLRRQYSPEVVDQLALITLGRAAGLKLGEISRMLATGRARVDRTVLAARADEFDEQIRQLTAIRDGLRHAAVCPATDHLECPKFRRLMGLAVLRAKSRPGKRVGRKRRSSLPRPGPRQ